MSSLIFQNFSVRQYLSDDWGGDREVHRRLQTSPLQTGADG